VQPDEATHAMSATGFLRSRFRPARAPGRPDEVAEAAEAAVVTEAVGRARASSAINDRTTEILAHRRGRSIAKRRGWIVRRALLLADVLGIIAGVAVARLLDDTSPWYALMTVFGLSLGKLYGLYDGDEEQAHHTTVGDLIDVFHVFTVSAFLMIVIAAGFGDALDIGSVALLWAATGVFVTANRVIARAAVRRSIAYQQNAVIVGAGEIGQLIARKILQHPEYGINVVGFVDANPKAPREDLGDLTILGGAEDLRDIVSELDIDRVIVAFSNESNEGTLALVRELRDRSMQIDIVPRLFEAVGPNAGIHSLEGLPLMGLPSVRITRTSRWVKRAIDVAVSSALLLAAAPLFAFIAFKVRRSSPGPVFFRQQRLGLDQRPFTMFKFRTMYTGTDELVHRDYIRDTMLASASPTGNGLYKLSRPDAVTPVGAWLRRASLDELPQLLNVLRGDMSLVGPRPCLPYETEFFEPHHFERFLVPQGMTGLWQVEGRALMTPKEGFDLDVAYARAWSFKLDLSLLFRTTAPIVRGGRAV
jgi:exopolysaccharide biosynthesis polyprenyl glycosylphosphotransferase